MRVRFYVVFSKALGTPNLIIADSHMDFIKALNNLVECYGPFELIYRG